MMMRAPLACLSAGVLLSGWGGNVWVAGNGNQDRQILKFSPEGRWAPSAAPAAWRASSSGSNNIAIDPQGNLHSSEVGFGRRIQKFERVN
jgi:hypothetical protein